jgi:DNA-binding response OmpR family regulator
MRPADPQEVTLLVVDDDAAARECLHDFLSDEGYSVHVAADGIEALRMLERCRPALVITDLEMPRMDGRTLIAALRERGSEPRIVVLTARMAIDASREAQQLGVDGYINKPIDLDMMSACVRALV